MSYLEYECINELFSYEEFRDMEQQDIDIANRKLITLCFTQINLLERQLKIFIDCLIVEKISEYISDEIIKEITIIER